MYVYDFDAKYYCLTIKLTITFCNVTVFNVTVLTVSICNVPLFTDSLTIGSIQLTVCPISLS